MEPPDANLKQPSFAQHVLHMPATPSLRGLPTETITQICEDLEPVDVASLRLAHRRFADIGRPFLAPKHCNLYFSGKSFSRLRAFTEDTQWKRRIEGITYNVGDRIDICSRRLDRATFNQWIEHEDSFSDRKAKKEMFRTYDKWITDQLSAEKWEMARARIGYRDIARMIEVLPNLQSFSVVTLPCMARGHFPTGVKRMIDPHGSRELRCALLGLSKHLREKCSTFRAVGMDQRLFGEFGPVVSPEITTITKLELLIKDEYCQATYVSWNMETLPGFLESFPKLEELTLSLDCCQETDCLGQFYAPHPPDN